MKQLSSFMALNIERQYYYDRNGKPFRTRTEAKMRMRQLESANFEAYQFVVGDDDEPASTTTFDVVENIIGEGYVIKQTITYR